VVYLEKIIIRTFEMRSKNTSCERAVLFLIGILKQISQFFSFYTSTSGFYFWPQFLPGSCFSSLIKLTILSSHFIYLLYSKNLQLIKTLVSKVYNANFFWISTLFRKIDRKIVFDFASIFIRLEELFFLWGGGGGGFFAITSIYIIKIDKNRVKLGF
jgi:hypothetical protein